MTKRINALQNRAGNILGAKGRGRVRLEGAASMGRGNLAGTNWGAAFTKQGGEMGSKQYRSR